MVVGDVCQSQLLISTEEGIGEDSDGDDLAVCHSWLRASGTWVVASSVKELADVINDDEQGNENVFPAVLGDEIGDMGHGAPPCRVIKQL